MQKPDHGPTMHSYGVNNGCDGISPAEMFTSQPPTQCQPTHIDTMSSDHFPSLTSNIVTNNKLMNQLQQQAINPQSTMPPAHMPDEQYPITNATMTLLFPQNITIPSSSQPTNFIRNVSNEEACLSQTIEQSHVHDKTEANMIQIGINKENQHTVNDTCKNPSELIPENNSKSNTLPKTHVSSEKSINKGVTHISRSSVRSVKRSQSANPYSRSVSRNRNGISPSTKNSTTGKQSDNDPRACTHANN
ncbi:uncharacterized protein LOC132714944 [Ruditapes philippinarum]|uniref:uncharacterized protein LOC132714944 n=1 Tax=Ruditapes philippinarum TaxID=129788 RepID=UPI00295B63D5|nr:uncharacterized protein LOC132714944 [Ruditapes philippinarum]